MFSGKAPTVPRAGFSISMERPHPGQKTAVSGICAAQWGHEVSGTLAAASLGIPVESIVGTISKRAVGGKWWNQSSGLTRRSADSMVRAKLDVQQQTLCACREDAWRRFVPLAETASRRKINSAGYAADPSPQMLQPVLRARQL